MHPMCVWVVRLMCVHSCILCGDGLAGLLIPGQAGSTVRARFEKVGCRKKLVTLGSTPLQDCCVDLVLDRVPMKVELVVFQWLRVPQKGSGSVQWVRLFQRVFKWLRVPHPLPFWWGWGVQVACVSILSFAGAPVAGNLKQLLAPLAEVSRPTQQGLASMRAPALVLDLRGNAGGSLTQAQNVVKIIVDLSTKRSTAISKDTAAQRAEAAAAREGLAVVVLADGDTASAAEAVILGLQAARRQGQLRAVLVLGASPSQSTTFGKGTAQSRFELSDSSALLLTVSCIAASLLCALE